MPDLSLATAPQALPLPAPGAAVRRLLARARTALALLPRPAVPATSRAGLAPAGPPECGVFHDGIL